MSDESQTIQGDDIAKVEITNVRVEITLRDGSVIAAVAETGGSASDGWEYGFLDVHHYSKEKASV